MPQIPFNVDAYTAKLIGRENVSKLDGAILELVKNAYDADASICFLYFEKITNTLYIGDNGTGMAKNIIINHWMTIGNSSKKTNYETNRGRIQTGAKGIGRFALDRIADKCSLLTISDEDHLLWTVDWSLFEFGHKITDITATLDESDVSFKKFICNVKNGEVMKIIDNSFKNTGTIFKLTNLRDTWDTETIDSIKLNLKTLIPPEFKEVFNIYFFEQDTSLVDAELLQDSDEFSFDYKIKFTVLAGGNVNIELLRDEFDFASDFDKVISEAGFSKEDRNYFRKKPIVINTTFSEIVTSKETIENSIGDFRGILYFAKITAPKSEKEKYYYKDITGRTNIRDSFGGIKIYRDGFRVRPYGDPKTSTYDWLMLASRKNRSPAAVSHETGAWRVNADQIHGSIYISRTNMTLPDQANRQGIVETKEFKLLRQFIENIIKLFERDRQNVCRILNRYYDKIHPTAAIENEFHKKLAEDNKNQKDVEKNIIPSYTPTSMNVAKIAELIIKKDAAIQELENEIQMLRVLATTGIVTNTYIHEIKELTHKLNMTITLAKEYLEIDHNLDNALRQLEIAHGLREVFTSWFKVTIESVQRSKRTLQEINIQLLLSKLISAWNETLKPKNIEILFSDKETIFRCFPYEIESIINNLIANSVASFDKVIQDKKSIFIEVHQTETGILLDYSDDGAGLSSVFKKNPRLILEPFETDRKSSSGEPIGTGMGMWIINRITNEYNGTIDLSKNMTSNSGFHIHISLKSK